MSAYNSVQMILTFKYITLDLEKFQILNSFQNQPPISKNQKRFFLNPKINSKETQPITEAMDQLNDTDFDEEMESSSQPLMRSVGQVLESRRRRRGGGKGRKGRKRKGRKGKKGGKKGGRRRRGRKSKGGEEE